MPATRSKAQPSIHDQTRKAEFMANTKSITDKAERKKLKRAARKKAAPKAARTHARGSAKRKVKKMARGQSKR
jgi:hypothetical protein